MTKGKKILTHAILILASFLSVFPLYYMLCGATNPSIDVIRGKLIPGTYLIENFKALVANQNLALAMTNSFRNAILMTFITLLVCSIAGYGFEIYHDKAKDILMSVLLLAMMLPFVAIMIPLFKMISGWGLVNSWAAFVLPSISTPFMIMLFRQAARSFPNDIIEAARLEGLSEIGIFFRMFIPIMRSTYGAAMTVTFMNAWNSYLWPKIVFQNNGSITMPMLVANLKSGYSVDYGMLMLGVLICTLPTAIIFLSCRRALPTALRVQSSDGADLLFDPGGMALCAGLPDAGQAPWADRGRHPCRAGKAPRRQKCRNIPQRGRGRAGIRHTVLFRPGLPAV